MSRPTALHPLLAFLDCHTPDEAVWRGWRVQRVAGGMNNRLYRATAPGADLAIKFTLRDARDRAGREFQGLATLQEVGLSLAPRPLLLDRERYRQPVVVQTWLAGEPLTAPPATDEAWLGLLRHLATVHSVTPTRVARPLPPAVLNAASVATCQALLHQQAALLPPAHVPPALPSLLRAWEARRVAEWPPVALTLCRGDNNVRNFIRSPDGWRSVDWEYSGWGDPAFEVGEMLAQPSWQGVPAARRAWVAEQFGALEGDGGAAERVALYYRTMLVWWVARFARLLYEAPLGQDERLVARPADWTEATRAKVAHYVAHAQAAMDDAG